MEKLEVPVYCGLCGSKTILSVPYDGFLAWKSGTTLIQRAMPNLTPDERELLISNTCPKCWNELFPPDKKEQHVSI